jgi:hypothetical protein
MPAAFKILCAACAPVIPDILRYFEYFLNVLFTWADARRQITAPIITKK